MTEKFLQLLRCALGTCHEIPHLKGREWDMAYRIAQQQSLVGVLFGIIEQNRYDSIGMSQDLMLDWFSFAEQIRLRNSQMDEQCMAVCKEYREAGFDCCVLKGQGNAVLYDKGGLRTPGDIDVWVTPHSKNGTQAKYKANVLKVIDYVKKHKDRFELRYYHIEYGEKGVSVEAHFTPGIMNNPFYNYRLQRWFQEQKDEQMHHYVDLSNDVGKIAVPTIEFNIVYQMAHVMHHFFDEGVGLKHLVDYFFLLKKYRGESFGNQSKLHGNKSWEREFNRLGMLKFAGAVMWTLHAALGMEEELLLVPADPNRGRMLMREILRGGNLRKIYGLAKLSVGEKYFLKHWRNLHFVRLYPSEALCEPLFRTWHFFWRMWMGRTVL